VHRGRRACAFRAGERVGAAGAVYITSLIVSRDKLAALVHIFLLTHCPISYAILFCCFLEES
jgi:hypothetical protein